jgi:acetylornithine deacetylase/succinyl-diaminopimelate desuccinylase-like protein
MPVEKIEAMILVDAGTSAKLATVLTYPPVPWCNTVGGSSRSGRGPATLAAARLTLRPSLAITGMRGGSGKGPKGVIPSCAAAKLSFRLVPDQEPPEIERLVVALLRTLHRQRHT